MLGILSWSDYYHADAGTRCLLKKLGKASETTYVALANSLLLIILCSMCS